MTNEEKEGTKLILQFLNLEPNEGGEYEMYGVIESIEDNPRSKHFYSLSEMLFHSDWNWLMPVIQAINQTPYAGGILYALQDALLQGNLDLVFKEVIVILTWMIMNKK